MSNLVVVIVGNLSGRRPELQQPAEGSPFCVVDVATSSLFAEGSHESKPKWFKVKVRGKQAETVVKYHSKGKEIFILGTLTFSEWTNRDGRLVETAHVSASIASFTGGDGIGVLLREAALVEREGAVEHREGVVSSAERRLQSQGAQREGEAPAD